MPRQEPVQYVVARIREVLAEDDRTNVLDVQVRIAAGKIFLIGEVPSHELRRSAEEAVREIAPAEMPIINELWVADYTGRPETEWLP